MFFSLLLLWGFSSGHQHIIGIVGGTINFLKLPMKINLDTEQHAKSKWKSIFANMITFPSQIFNLLWVTWTYCREAGK